ncbi:MAG: radical SAM family heme chaperone HemW [Longimicrobiales bacterium]|nr:radical SAM family heme chaperone HemW [Longimicrobiales bacterium]
MAHAQARTRLPAAGGVNALYVHAPFCARRCGYCDFAVQVRRTGDLEAWTRALRTEMELLEAAGVRLADRLGTLYVGGGTPSLLGPNAMAALADVLGRERLGAPALEWTTEANPESFTPELARAWRRAGVTRLSLGVQSFHDGVLRWMGRMHGPEGARAAVRNAGAAGFESVSVDLIFGLPEGVERDWRRDLDEVERLQVPHVSLYGLTAEPGTPLGRSVAAGRTRMAPEERYREEYLTAHQRLTAMGLRAYEVSNFARPGYESRHNLGYWDGTPYLGLGNGSHSFLPPVRRWNLRDWGAYLKALEEGRLPEEDRESIGGDADRMERVWLGLRTIRGIPDAWLRTADARGLVSGWVAQGLAVWEDGRVRLTPEGWLLLDRLAVELSDHAVCVPLPSAPDRRGA